MFDDGGRRNVCFVKSWYCGDGVWFGVEFGGEDGWEWCCEIVVL